MINNPRQIKSLSDILVIAHKDNKTTAKGINIPKLIEDYYKLSITKDKNEKYKYTQEYCATEIYKKYLKGDYKR